METEEVLRQVQADLLAGRPHSPRLKAALSQVFGGIRPRVMAVCLRLFRNREQAEEATQSAFAIALQKLPEFGFLGSFEGYVCGIARNVYRNKLKKLTETLSDDGVLDSVSDDISALSALREEEREALFEEIYHQLPADDQVVLDLYRLGWSYAQIDAELGLQGSGARAALVKARRHLRTALRDELERRGHGSSFFWTTVP